jgi:parallel beta-helix repeat protein
MACSFEGGASYQIEGDDVADLVIKGNNFKTASKTAIMLEASGATADMLRIEVEGNNFFGCTGDVISILGADGNFNAPQSHIRVAGNKANGLNGIKVGSAVAKVQYVSISDNIVPSSYDNGLMVCAKYGTINGNVMPGATDDGLDLLDSRDLVVKGNSFRDSGKAGIRFVDAEDCLIADNDCTDSTTRIVISDSITSPCRHYGNTDETPEAGPVRTWRVDSDTFDIPANTLKIGDVLTIHAMWTDNTVGTQGVRVGGTYIVSDMSDGAGETTVIASLYIKDATTLDALAVLLPDGNDINASGPSTSGYDFTSTVSVSIIGTDNTNQEMIVTIGRGVSI